jgi:hypothetical protein
LHGWSQVYSCSIAALKANEGDEDEILLNTKPDDVMHVSFYIEDPHVRPVPTIVGRRV